MPRCDYRLEKCATENPKLEPVSPGHKTACWVDVRTERTETAPAGEAI